MQPNILQLYSANTQCTTYGVSWVPQSGRLISVGMTSRGGGSVQVWGVDDEAKGRNPLRLLESHEKAEALKCVSFGASLSPQRAFCTGDHKGNLFIFDVERLGTPLYSVRAHGGILHCCEGIGGRNPGQCGAPEIATGGADGFVRLWDPRQQNPVLELTCSEASETRIQIDKDKHIVSKPECWAVAMGGAANTSDRYLAAGFDSGDLKIVDLRMMRIAYEHHFANGITGIEFDRQDTGLNRLTLGTLEGHCYSLDCSKGLQQEPGIVDFKPFGDSSTIWTVRHSPFNRDVLLCSGGNKLGLLKYEYPQQRYVEEKTVPGALSMKADAVVTQQTTPAISWHREKPGLVAWTSMDQQVSIGFVTNMRTLE